MFKLLMEIRHDIGFDIIHRISVLVVLTDIG